MKFSKLTVTLALAFLLVGLILLALPVGATVTDDRPREIVAQQVPIIGGRDYKATPYNSGGADLEMNSNGTLLAMTYYKLGGAGAVYIKSSDPISGWRTTGPLGNSEFPARVAFDPRPAHNYKAYVVFIENDIPNNRNYVRFSYCELSANARPDCDPKGTVYDVAPWGVLYTPDVAVDSSGRVHVAWEEDGVIKTRMSNDGGQSWGTVSPPIMCAGDGGCRAPVLAAANSLHLAFLSDGSDTDPEPDTIFYYRSGLTGHSWLYLKDYNIDGEIISTDQSLGNPTLIATGTNVSMAWDARVTTDTYTLMEATSTNTGTTWSAGNYITSAIPINAQDSEQRLSETLLSPVPTQLNALRPSLAFSGSNRVVVWQQGVVTVTCPSRPKSSIISEIFYAYDNNFANPGVWINDSVLSDTTTASFLDPDIAVSPTGGVRHIVYMKDDEISSSCIGFGDEFAIFYHGPWNNFSNDTGEGGVFLPIILKRSP